ncbi:MAG TPA: flavin reductase family protein [Dehalococcoidia bacterium]|nr:flavin reductase family protein [Dehalococcoidia bacterium]
MSRRALDPLDALRLLGGGPVALVTTRWRDKTDAMPAIWTTPLSRVPALIGVVVNPARHTHDMIRFSESFALNFPARDLMNHTQYFGTVSGTDVNKIELTHLSTFGASKIEAPLLESCIAWVECEVVDTLPVGDHTLFVGRVMAVQADEEAFAETWTLGDLEYRPLHYLGLDRYATLHEQLKAELRTDDEGTIDLGDTQVEREKRVEAEAKERERKEREGEEPIEGETP